MKPVKLFASHYGPYETVSWDVPTGVTAVVGRNDGEGINSNGAGKTKLLEILPLALFGPSSALSEHLTMGGSATTCEVGLEFEHSGDLYRIRRTYTAQGRGKTTLAFERHASAESWDALGHEHQGETQKAIEELLGVAETTFQQSVFSRQFARHFANPDLPPRERKEILAQTLGLGVYDTLLETARKDSAALETQLATLRGSLETWERQADQHAVALLEVDGLRADAERLEAEVTTWRERHEQLRASYEQARQARDRVADAAKLAQARRQTFESLDGRRAAADDAEFAAAEIKAALPDLDEKVAAGKQAGETGARLKEANETRARALAERLDLEERAEQERRAAGQLTARIAQFTVRAGTLEAQLVAPPETCDRCGNPVEGDAAERVAAALRADLDALEQESRNLTADADVHRLNVGRLAARAAEIEVPDPVDEAELARLREVFRVGQESETAAVTAQSRLEVCERQVVEVRAPEFAAGLEQARVDLAAAEQALADLEASVIPEERSNELARDTLGAKIQAQQAQEQLDRARTQLGAAEQRLQTAVEAGAKAKGALADRGRLEQRARVLAELAKLYGRDGIPALIMESTAIPKIEREAERVLQALGVPFRVELRTQATQKTTDRLKDTLDVVVHEPNGERSYETYSGGERARINVALRIALARLLAHRRGSSMDVFALDEVEHLDAAGVTKLAELLRDLQREIPVVLFISHVETLTDSFDQTITVIREDGRSRIEMSA